MRISISKDQLLQLSHGRDLSTEGQGLGCVVCFAQQTKRDGSQHFNWCWVGQAIKKQAIQA